MNPQNPFPQSASGADPASLFADRVAWKAQRLAWKMRFKAERARQKAEREAWRAQWRAGQWHRWGFVSPVWSVFPWTLIWVVFGLAIAFSPSFRDGFIGVVTGIAHVFMHVLQVLAGRGEI